MIPGMQHFTMMQGELDSMRTMLATTEEDHQNAVVRRPAGRPRGTASKVYDAEYHRARRAELKTAKLKGQGSQTYWPNLPPRSAAGS